MNYLYHGDNVDALQILIDKKTKAKVVYIDPPFATDRIFQDIEDNTAYSDKIKGVEFIEFMRKRLVLARDILDETGSIYVHLDQKMGHHVKVLMDSIFDEKNFINDITRIKCNPKGFKRKGFGNVKDVIYFYAKNKDKMFWADLKLPLTEAEIVKQFPKKEPNGRRYATTPVHAPGASKPKEDGQLPPTGQAWRGKMPPKGRHWREPPAKLDEYDAAGLLEWSSNGNPRKKIYADEHEGNRIQDVWEFKDPGRNRSSYPTEKNIKLLERIISCSSKPGDLVVDFFCGSGTTLLAASNLNRVWIGVDESDLAVKVCSKRLKNTEYELIKI